MNRRSVDAPDKIDPAQRYSIAEASAILRVSVATVYRDIKAKRLKSFTTDGRRRRFVSGRELLRLSKEPR